MPPLASAGDCSDRGSNCGAANGRPWLEQGPLLFLAVAVAAGGGLLLGWLDPRGRRQQADFGGVEP